MAAQINGKKKQLKIDIIGGGLVGSACACFMAKRGHKVNLYEYRKDIRIEEQMQGRSINLAMSTRARAALKEIGLEDHMIQEHGIPMAGRMIHNLDSSQHSIPYDKQTKQCIYSVGRKYLNEVLLTAAEKYENVNLHFNHKLVNANLSQGKLTLMKSDTNETVEKSTDLVIGADGAFSAIRRSMMKQPLFNFSQTYTEQGYLELCILPKDGQFAMDPNHLHIWPRGEFMMIALPNQDRTWTVTLFMPFTIFDSLDSPERLLSFFHTYFPDSVALIGEKRLIADFFKCKPSTMVSVKCHPYHVDDKAIIIGDAAHAMLPFYGQGMNAGFEDCLVLDQLMDKFDDDLSQVLQEFTKLRNVDGHAICDLAMYNYIEMRDLVNKKSFRLRKSLDDFLFWLLPQFWVPLYNTVSFSRMRYSDCAKNRQWQDNIISYVLIAVFILFIIVIGFSMFSFNNNVTDFLFAQKLLS